MHTEKTELEEYFSLHLGRPVSLTITNNVRSMISFKDKKDGTMLLRLHNMFYNAPENILRGVTNWIKYPQKGSSLLKQFMKENKSLVRTPAKSSKSRRILNAVGRYYDLRKIFARINADYFESRLEMRITWGKKLNFRHTKSMQLGTFCPESGVITISRRLDSIRVPQYFLSYVVYHEMLHAHVGIKRGANGRRKVHGRDFKALERKFADYERAQSFEKKFFG